MKKKFLALLCVAVLAFSALPLTAFAAEDNGVSLDFSTAADAEYFTNTNSSWSVNEETGRYHANSAWATAYLNTAIDFTTDKYIAFDMCLKADSNKQFNVGLAATTNFMENCLGISFRSGTTWLCSALGGTWQGEDNTKDYFDETVYNVKISVKNKVITFVINGVEFASVGGVSSLNLTVDSAYLVFQATSTESYIDNLVISDKDIEYVPPVVDNSYEEISLDFSKSSDVSKYFTDKVGGWKSDGGWFYPNDKYSSTYLTQELKMDGEKYIAFDFYISKNNDGAANTQFNVGIMNDLSADSCTACLHGIMNGDATLFSLNKSLGSIEKSLLTYNVNWADGYEHNLKIIINKNTLSFAIDGELLKDGDEVYVMELLDSAEQNDSYLVLQASNTLCYIDNFVVSNTDITYTAPEKFGEFAEFTKTFDEADSDVKKANGSSGAWQVVDGKLSAGAAWSVGYIDKKIPLNQDKTISMNFKATNEASHQFIVSLKKNPNHVNENGIACTKGFALHFYNGQVLLTYNAGGPVNEIATATANTDYCDGEEHTLKIIVRNFKAYVLIDDVVLFKGLYLGAGYGYLTLQSTNTTDYIDNLSIKNAAEAISVPSVDGDISTDNVETQAPTADGIESSLKKVGCSGQVNASDIVISAVAVLLAVCVLVYKKRKA